MVAGTVEKIQVMLQVVTSGFTKGLERTQKQLKGVGKNIQGFGEVMKMPMNNFKEMNNNMKAMQSTGGRVAKRFRMMTHGMRGFRMEALGVMFFGMMMQKMFMGLLQPVMEAFGVFDVFRLMLLTLFLPVMEMIFPFLLTMMEWFMNLPEPVKKAIGIFVVLGAIFGTIIMVIGQFTLGIGSMILMFGSFGAVVAIIGTVAAVLIGLVLIVKGIYMIFKKKFEGIGIVIMGIGVILLLFIGWWALIPIAIGAAVYLIIKHWDKFKAFFVRLWEGIVKLYNSKIGWLIFPVFKVIELIIKAFKWLKDKLVGHSIIPDMIKAIISWFWKIPNVIKTVVKFVGNAFIGVGNAIINVWNKVMGAISKAIVTVLRGVDVVIGVLNKIPGVNIGGYSWNISWGHIPSIPYLADGGIVTRPTLAMIGESGPEAVVPLGGGGGLGAGGNITQENHFHGFTMDDLKRELDNRDRRLVDDIRRLVKQ